MFFYLMLVKRLGNTRKFLYADKVYTINKVIAESNIIGDLMKGYVNQERHVTLTLYGQARTIANPT